MENETARPLPHELQVSASSKMVAPNIDLGALLVEDNEPLDDERLKSNKDAYLKCIARDNIQHLFNKAWDLPTERVEDAIVVELSPMSTVMPREKPVPRARQATKWENYAKLKGIQNKKKSRMMWSEESQDWKPRWGYNRANGDEKNWVIEIPHQKDPYTDYIGEANEKKKERVARNELQRLKNIQHEVVHRAEVSGMSVEQKSSEQLGRQLKRGKMATASMGKFTPDLRKEKAPKRSDKKNQFVSNEMSVKSEQNKQLLILSRLQSSKTPLDVQKAVGKVINDENSNASETRAKTRSFDNKSMGRSAQRKKSRSKTSGFSKKSAFTGRKTTNRKAK